MDEYIREIIISTVVVIIVVAGVVLAGLQLSYERHMNEMGFVQCPTIGTSQIVWRKGKCEYSEN